jgi:hypothetical protein
MATSSKLFDAINNFDGDFERFGLLLDNYLASVNIDARVKVIVVKELFAFSI